MNFTRAQRRFFDKQVQAVAFAANYPLQRIVVTVAANPSRDANRLAGLQLVAELLQARNDFFS